MQRSTWLDKSNVEDLLDEAVVGGDLIDGARCVLYADDVHWNKVVRHSTPEHLSVLFAYLEYLRPQPVTSAIITVTHTVRHSRSPKNHSPGTRAPGQNGTRVK